MTTASIQKLRELSGQLIDPDIAIAIFERLPDAVVVVDAVGDIQLVNQQAEFLFGYHRRAMSYIGNTICSSPVVGPWRTIYRCAPSARTERNSPPRSI